MAARTRRRSRATTAPMRRASRRMTATAAAALSVLALVDPRCGPPGSEAFGPPLSTARPSTSLSRPSYRDGPEITAGGEVPRRARADRISTRLTRGEELALLRQMKSHPADASLHQAARQTLLLRNLPLVRSVVSKVVGSRPSSSALTGEDLLHEGTIGLGEAIDRYDLAYARDGDEDGSTSDASSAAPSSSVPDGGARLGTYATYWIRARVLRAMQSREHEIFRFPEHVSQASHRLVRAANAMGLEWDEVVEMADYDVISASQMKLREELREAAGIPSESLFREAVRVRELSRVRGTSSSAPLEDFASPRASYASEEEEAMTAGAGREHIRETLSRFLVPREVEVLSLRYGLVQEEEEDVPQRRVFRDYQAEAEEDLFGPGGMLSHYSSAPNDGTRAATAAQGMAAAARGRGKARVAPTLSSNALLPFKEVGRRMKFSGEYCRRTCAAALDKLARAAEEGRLAESDFLLGW